jgi:TolA-binding protein
MDTLESTYEAKKQQYDTLRNGPDATTNADRIQALNTELAALLQDMLSQVATMRGNASKLESYRDELIKKLVRVQNDYTIIQSQKDEYATLQKIQSHEQTTFNSTFFWYGIALAIVFLIFFFTLVRKGQSAPTMPTMTTSATTMPAFM